MARHDPSTFLSPNPTHTRHACDHTPVSRTDWFGNTFPPRTDPPCPSGILAGENWSDFCSGKYMHFDLVRSVSLAVLCQPSLSLRGLSLLFLSHASCLGICPPLPHPLSELINYLTHNPIPSSHSQTQPSPRRAVVQRHRRPDLRLLWAQRPLCGRLSAHPVPPVRAPAARCRCPRKRQRSCRLFPLWGREG